MARSIIGQEAIIERLLGGLLANGNLLIEFVEALVRAAREPKAPPPGQALEPLNPR